MSLDRILIGIALLASLFIITVARHTIVNLEARISNIEAAK